jgi:rhamnulokinase
MRGAFGLNSLCRDFTGLWLLERCLAGWRKEEPCLGYKTVLDRATAAAPNDTYLNLSDDALRYEAGDAKEAIAGFCGRTAQKNPSGIGEIALCVLESITLETKRSFEALQRITGKSYSKLCAVGGGVRNTLLLQMLANALELPVIAGSPYATTAGNILMQLYTRGEIHSQEEMAVIADRTSGISALKPRYSGDKWEKALTRLNQYRKL